MSTAGWQITVGEFGACECAWEDRECVCTEQITVPANSYVVLVAASEADHEWASRQLLGAVHTLDETVELVMDAHATGRYKSTYGGNDLVLTDERVAYWDDVANCVTGYEIYRDGKLLHSWVDEAFVIGEHARRWF